MTQQAEFPECPLGIRKGGLPPTPTRECLLPNSPPIGRFCYQPVGPSQCQLCPMPELVEAVTKAKSIRGDHLNYRIGEDPLTVAHYLDAALAKIAALKEGKP